MVDISDAFPTAFSDTLVRTEPDPQLHDALKTAARLVCHALSYGYACLPLDNVPKLLFGIMSEKDRQWAYQPERWYQTLLKSRAVAHENLPENKLAPLWLDHKRRLFLYRYHQAEKQLASAIQARLSLPQTPVSDKVTAFLDSLFNHQHTPQRSAVEMSLSLPFSLLSGGPGTGKTHTMVALLIATWLDHPKANICLVAPTGKAAARMKESIDALWPVQIQHTSAQDQPALKERKLPQPTTIHRFLSIKPFDIKSGQKNLSEKIDLLIVDEASMMDSMLAFRLLAALSPHTRLLLIGDADQLIAIEAGQFFSECCHAAELLHHRPFMTRLTHNYRFGSDSPIGQLATFIRENRLDHVENLLRQMPALKQEAAASALYFLPVFSQKELIADIIDAYQPLIDKVRQHPEDLAGIFAQLAAFKVITPTHHGAYGVKTINQKVSEQFMQSKRSPYFAGQLILITQNQHRELVNGDMGIVIDHPQKPRQVYFPMPNDAGYLAIAPSLLPPHETAFAMTVHKVQGSEFDEVMVIMPDYAPLLLSKRLLYTAITRARRRLTLVANMDTLAKAISQQEDFPSGLSDHFETKT